MLIVSPVHRASYALGALGFGALRGTAGALAVLVAAPFFGFEIQAWTEVEGDRFVWLLRWSGRDSFAEADARYYASAERKALDPDPAQWIVANETFAVQEVSEV